MRRSMPMAASNPTDIRTALSRHVVRSENVQPVIEEIASTANRRVGVITTVRPRISVSVLKVNSVSKVNMVPFRLEDRSGRGSTGEYGEPQVIAPAAIPIDPRRHLG